MNRKKGKGKRGLAFLLSLTMLLGSINVSPSAAAIWDVGGGYESVDIFHTLTDNGMTANIYLTEARPDIRITNVEMTKGEEAPPL